MQERLLALAEWVPPRGDEPPVAASRVKLTHRRNAARAFCHWHWLNARAKHADATRPDALYAGVAG
jgi:hypothetical protein